MKKSKINQNTYPETLMVALDMTFMDQLLVRYLQFLVESLGSVKKIIFYHNIRFDYPDRARYLLKDLKKPLDEVLKDRMKKLVMEIPGDVNFEYVIAQAEDTAHDILTRQKEAGVNLILMGKKVSYDGSGYLIERIMYQKPYSDILLVPETSYHRLSRILAPVDFSKKSAKALKQGYDLAAVLDGELVCQHVHNVPRVYFPFIPIKSLQKEMQEESDRQWAQFLKKYFTGYEPPEITFSFHGDRSIAQMIYDFAVEQQIDIIVVPAEDSIIQSTVIQLLKLNMHLPMWVVSD